MSLQQGSRLGPYEIVAPLGAGGMGEVYRARDRRLDRTVAIKVLPSHVAAEPDLRERFEREARSISALDHPHICALYDVGEHGGTAFLVMQHLEGETLAARIARAALPVPEAVQIAAEIADALDRAHRAGIVHRDLKPANVMLTTAGAKLLDFGLAKMTAPAAPAAASMLPTEHTPPLTVQGAILGTFHYMAPEQLEGREADARSDIFAFGCVLYEMLTGTRPFAGGTQATLMAAILERQPKASRELRPEIPPPLERLVERCLEKDPEQRWQNARDLMLELRSRPQDTAAETALAPARPWRSIAAAALLTGLAAAVFAYLLGERAAVDPPAWSTTPIRFTIAPPPGTSFYNGDYSIPFAVSRDGRAIVFAATSLSDGRRHLWLRRLDADVAQPIAGTDGGSSPFWSPDNEWVGFIAEDSLKTVRLAGGLPQVIARFASSFKMGAAWGSQGVIVYQAKTASGLSRISAQGGGVSEATKLDANRPESYHAWPQWLSDGNRFVYLELNPGRISVAALDAEAPRVLMEMGALSSLGYAPGHLLYVKDAVLYARPFDEDRLEFVGEPARIADGIPMSGPGRAPFAVSANGVLAYSSHAIGEVTTLQWFDRSGRPGVVAAPPANYAGFSVTPDGRRLALARWGERGGRDIWLRDLVRGGESRLTDDGDSMMPLWAPHSNRLTFASARERPPDLFLKDLAGSARERELTTFADVEIPHGWSADEKFIVYERQGRTGSDLWSLAVESGESQALPFNTTFTESQGRLSPDGRWIAYLSSETGRDNVFVARFPSGLDKRAVSVEGGAFPEWRADGRELFYLSRDQQLMAVAIRARAADLDVGAPAELFRVDRAADLAGRTEAVLYRADRDGQRFLFAVKAPDATPPIHVVVNWPALIERR